MSLTLNKNTNRISIRKLDKNSIKLFKKKKLWRSVFFWRILLKKRQFIAFFKNCSKLSIKNDCIFISRIGCECVLMRKIFRNIFSFGSSLAYHFLFISPEKSHWMTVFRMTSSEFDSVESKNIVCNIIYNHFHKIYNYNFLTQSLAQNRKIWMHFLKKCLLGPFSIHL